MAESRIVSLQAGGNDAANRRAQLETDRYGFRERFRTASVDELVRAFNGDRNTPAWVSARGAFWVALGDALIATGLDVSSFISEGAISLARPIERRGEAIVPIETGS